MNYVKNKEVLLSHGDAELRSKAIEIIEAALDNAYPYEKTKRLVHVDGDMLHVGNNQFDLSYYKRIYVLGAGKATYPIAKALDDILGSRITDGVVICKYGQDGELEHCRLYHASHPVPDENGYAACKELMKICRQTTETDIVFSISTGGSTSLMPYPVEGVTIADKAKTGMLLLRSGADIWEMNYVRKHLTQAKSGFMALAIHPKCPIINIGVADGIGQDESLSVEPTTPDQSTFDDARRVLTKYDLWDKVPESVADYIRNGTEAQEPPRNLSNRTIYNHLIVDMNSASEGALVKAKDMGFNACILSQFIDGESREVGKLLAAIGKEILYFDRPLKKPACIISGGETTMHIGIPEPGPGGPNQQVALASALALKGCERILVASVDTDGTDGPTDLAGGLVDCTTSDRAEELDVDIQQHIDRFSDSTALKRLEDAIFTGGTGTNVNDLRIILVT